MRPERSGTPRPESIRPSGEGLRRERHGHADHRRGPRSGLAPERLPEAVVPHPGARRREPGLDAGRNGGPRRRGETASREDPAPPPPEEKDAARQQKDEAPRPRERPGSPFPKRNGSDFLRHGEGREARRGIALQEIEDLVASRIEARRERGPGHGGLRRNRRRERRVSAPGLQGREVREPPPRQHLLDDMGVHAVEPEDDDAGPEPARRPNRAPPAREDGRSCEELHAKRLV